MQFKLSKLGLPIPLKRRYACGISLCCNTPRHFHILSTIDFNSCYNPSHSSCVIEPARPLSSALTKWLQKEVSVICWLHDWNFLHSHRLHKTTNPVSIFSLHSAVCPCSRQQREDSRRWYPPLLAGWLNEPEAVWTDSRGWDVGNAYRDDGLVILDRCSFRNVDIRDDMQYDGFYLHSNSTMLRARIQHR
jgi:hypothetical protein